MTDSLPLLETEIRSLLDQPAAGRPPREVVEHTLTNGYAHVLRLDAQRLRTERRLRSLLEAGARADERDGADDPRALSRELGSLDHELERLRALLSTLRDQAL